jgi:hypothetical protein
MVKAEDNAAVLLRVKAADNAVVLLRGSFEGWWVLAKKDVDNGNQGKHACSGKLGPVGAHRDCG